MIQHVRKTRHILRRVTSMILVFIMLLSVVSTHIMPTEEYYADTSSEVRVVGTFYSLTNSQMGD